MFIFMSYESWAALGVILMISADGFNWVFNEFLLSSY
jgi:hypothetical protein